jgi:hypothetical protein
LRLLPALPKYKHLFAIVLDTNTRSWLGRYEHLFGGIVTAVALTLRPEALYWRRRAVALIMFAGLVIALVTLAARLGREPLIASEPTSPRVQLVGRRTHVVAPGDTLWTIARAIQPEGDVRPLVQHLAARRRGAPLQVGERIPLP